MPARNGGNMKYRVCKDGIIISVHPTEEEAKKALKALHLGQYSNGYLDEITDDDTERTLYQKLTTNGKLLECW